MKEKNSRHQNGQPATSFMSELLTRQRQRARAEALAAYEKAKANKIPGRRNWAAFLKKHRKGFIEFSRQRYGGGMEPLPHEKA